MGLDMMGSSEVTLTKKKVPDEKCPWLWDQLDKNGSWLWKCCRCTVVPNIPTSVTPTCQLSSPCKIEREGWMSPVKGLPPSEPPASFVFWIFWCIVIDFDVFFRSTPRKLSWPPLDRARRCDSFASNENFVAQIKTPFRACHLKSPYDIFFHLTYILLPN